VRDGANYGWPYANPNPDTAAGLNNMPFDFDAQNNPNWSLFPESAFTRIDKGIQAHSAPLGLSFLQGTNFPADYREGAVIGLHGSWNRQVKTGYKVR
jgi:glucose/arabinose dehydrogenase